MTAADAMTIPAAWWLTAIAEALGVELGRLVTLLAHDMINLAWVTGRMLAVLRWTLPRALRLTGRTAFLVAVALELTFCRDARKVARRAMVNQAVKHSPTRATVVRTTKGTRKATA